MATQVSSNAIFKPTPTEFAVMQGLIVSRAAPETAPAKPSPQTPIRAYDKVL